MIKCTTSLMALILGLLVQIIFAEIPRTMSYQGVLRGADGEVVADGNYTLTFTLSTSETNSSVIWEEVHENVAVEGGVFNVVLGSIKPIDARFDQPYYLGISVNGGAELSPRIELTASPYSFRANSVADSSVSGQSIAHGQVVRSINSLSEHVRLLPGENVTITESDTSLTISAATANGGSGDITAVTAGDGLTGGGESGDVELAIAEKGVTFDMLADSVVSGKKIADGQVLRALTIGPINSLFPVLTDSARLTFGSNLTMDAEAFPPGFLLNAVADGNSLNAADGSPSNAVSVDDNGNVGIGTSTPDVALDVQGDVNAENATVTDEIQRPATGEANMVPICYGNVDSDGTINTGTGNFSVNRVTNGIYEITIEDELFFFTDYIVSVTPATPLIVSYNSVSDNLRVEIENTDGLGTDAVFSFVVYKP